MSGIYLELILVNSVRSRSAFFSFFFFFFIFKKHFLRITNVLSQHHYLRVAPFPLICTVTSSIDRCPSQVSLFRPRDYFSVCAPIPLFCFLWLYNSCLVGHTIVVKSDWTMNRSTLINRRTPLNSKISGTLTLKYAGIECYKKIKRLKKKSFPSMALFEPNVHSFANIQQKARIHFAEV